MQAVIDLFSDTHTLPTAAMLDAIVRAPLGDDMMGEDPTVRALEARAAALTGMEAALLVTSGTQGNLVALMAHGGHGDELYLDAEAHVYFYEGGALCSVAGYVPRFVRAARGRMLPEALEAAVRPRDVHFPVPRLLWLENTHNRGGGAVLEPARQAALVGVARDKGLKVHLDGARLFNAAVALGKPADALCAGVDSVQFCLSKGLSCPVGSLVCGSVDFVARARRARKRLGGAMRQAGVIAACGLVALEDAWIARLAEDHERARRLAELIEGTPGTQIDRAAVETNMVFVDVGGWGVSLDHVCKRLEEKGLRVSPSPPSSVRMVTHRNVGDGDIAQAADIFRKVGARLARA